MSGIDDWQWRDFVKMVSSGFDKIQVQLNAIRENSQSNKHADKPQGQDSSRLETILPPAIGAYYQSEQDERPSNRRKALIKMGLEVIVVFTVIGTILVYREQWIAMTSALGQTQVSLAQLRRSLLLAERQARAAETAANAANKEFEMSQRPWLVIDSARIPSNNTIWFDSHRIVTALQLSIKNIGHSPAINLWVVPSLHYGGGPMVDIVRGICEGNGAPPPDSGFGEVIFPDRPNQPTTYPISLPASDVNAYWGHEGSTLGIVGCVAYRSTLSKELYYTGFNYDIFAAYPRVVPSIPVKIPGSSVFLMASDLGSIIK